MVRKKYLKLVKGPLFTIAAIGLMVQMVLQLVNFVISMVDVGNMASQASGVPVLEDVMGGMSVGVIIGNIIALIPIVLVALGALIFRCASREGSPGGAGCLKGGLITHMVMSIISVVFITIIGVIGMFIPDILTDALGMMVDFEDIMGVYIAVLICVIIYYILLISLFASLSSSVSAASLAIRSNTVMKKPSVYAAVMCFIWAVFNIVYIILLIVGMSNVGANISAVLGLVNSILGVVIFILVAIALIKGRGIKDDAVYEEEAEPAYYASKATYETKPIEPIQEEAVYAAPEEEKRYCIYCGKALYGDDVCECEIKLRELEHTPVDIPSAKEPEPTPYVPEIKPEPPVAGDVITTDAGSMVSGGLKSTMRAAKKEEPMDYKAMKEKEEGQSFFSKTTNLD